MKMKREEWERKWEGKDEELRWKGKNENEREYLQYLWLNKPEKKDILHTVVDYPIREVQRYKKKVLNQCLNTYT